MAKSRVREVVECVTKGEFRKFGKRIDKQFAAVDKRFAAVDKRFDELIATLGETIANAVVTIENNVARRLREELGADLARQLRASEERLTDQFRREMATQIRGSEERIRGEIRAIDDQYCDLPKRVARLEAHVGSKR